MAVPGVTLVHVLVAFVLGFALAYLLKRETYHRFPSPLWSPRPNMPHVTKKPHMAWSSIPDYTPSKTLTLNPKPLHYMIQNKNQIF